MGKLVPRDNAAPGRVSGSNDGDGNSSCSFFMFIFLQQKHFTYNQRPFNGLRVVSQQVFRIAGVCEERDPEE